MNPRTATRACSEPGCPTLVEGSNRCPEHAIPDRRGSRGYSLAAWQHARTKQLIEHPYCEGIERTDLTGFMRCTQRATQVDHIDGLGPRSPRGTDPTNLRSYCAHHHSQRTGRDHHPGTRLERGVA